MRLSLLALAILALAAPLVGQTTASGVGDFGDDSSEWANDGACDDTRFVGDRGAAAATSDDHVGRDATDCRNLLNAGRIQWEPALGEGTISDRFLLFSKYPPAEPGALVVSRSKRPVERGRCAAT